jgi:hypothetical protein
MELTTIISIVADVIACLGIPWALVEIALEKRANQQKQIAQELEEKRLNYPVTIVIKDATSNKSIQLPNTIRRRDVNRAEVLGRLGAVPLHNKDRFYLSYSSTKFIEAIDAIFTGEGQRLEILCHVDDKGINELEQFDREKIAKLGYVLTGYDA